MLVYGRDLIYRVTDFEKRVETVSLRPWQWDLLFALDGHTPLIDVAQSVGVDSNVASEALQSLQELGLVAVRSMRIDEYRKSFSRIELPKVPASSPISATPRPESAAPVPASGGVAFTLKPPSAGGVPDGSPLGHGSIEFKIK